VLANAAGHKNIEAAHIAGQPVRGEIERLVVLRDKRREFITMRIEIQVDRLAPLAIDVPRTHVEIDATVPAFPIAGEKQELPIETDTRLTVPPFGIDSFPERDNISKLSADEFGLINIARC